MKASLFQALTIVDMVVYIKENKPGLRRIKDIKRAYAFTSIGTDIRKTSLAIFMSEMLLNVCTRQQTGAEFYDFVVSSVKALEDNKQTLNAYHIVFLLELSGLLGFAPTRNFSQTHCFFNLREGVYQTHFEDASYSLSKEESLVFFNASSMSIRKDETKLNVSSQMRKALLQKTIDYYRIHLDGFREVKSHQVLEMVLN